MKVFIHLPKTGGTTLLHILSNQIYFERFKLLQPTRHTHPKDFLVSVESQIDQILQSENKTAVIGGHFGFCAHHRLNDPGSYFTVLRNPVERVISEYYFMKYKGMYYAKLIEDENLDLIGYINHPEIYYLNNLQTRLIAGEKYASGDQVTQRTFEKSLNHLRQFAAVGLTGQMEETLAMFYLMLGWKRLPYYLKANVNEHKPQESVSNEVRAAIEKREQFDLQLYNEATRLFNKQLNNHSSSLENVKRKIIRAPIYYKYYLKVLNKIRK